MFSYKLKWLAYNGTTEQLDITDKVLKFDYPLNIKKGMNLQNDVEGYLRVIDSDGLIEKILLGIAGYNVYGGAVKLEITNDEGKEYTFWTTGRYKRDKEIVEFEYSSEKRAVLPQNTEYKIADVNRILQIMYGLPSCNVTQVGTSTKLLYKLYAGVRIPQDLAPYEISYYSYGNSFYVLYRNILVKYDTSSIPYGIHKVVDISSFLDQDERILVSSLVDGAEDKGICGVIIGIESNALQVMVNAGSSSGTFNCFKVLRIGLNNLNLISKSNFLVKRDDIVGNPYPNYSFIAKAGGLYVFLFKGVPNGTLVVTDGTAYYKTLVAFPTNKVYLQRSKGFSWLGADGKYNVIILGLRMLWLKIWTSSGSIYVQTQSFVDSTYTDEVEGFWDGYIDSDNTFVHYVAVRKTKSGEAAQFGKLTISSSAISNSVHRILSYGVSSWRGWGYDSYYRQVEVYFTYNEGLVRKTKRFQTSYNGTTNDVEFAVYFEFANINRTEDKFIYFNNGANVGGVGVLGGQINLYATDWSDEILNTVPFGFINNAQVVQWDQCANSGLSLGIDEYFNAEIEEQRDYEAHKRMIIQTVDGETVIEQGSGWSYVDKVVSLPVTGEMARALLFVRGIYKKVKIYKVMSNKDITSVLGKKLSFRDPENRVQTAVLVAYSQDSSSFYVYDLAVNQPAVDIDWNFEEDRPSYLELDIGFSSYLVNRGTFYEHIGKMKYLSQGVEHPNRIVWSVYDLIENRNIASGSGPVSGQSVVYNIRWNDAGLSNYLVIVELRSEHAMARYSYEIIYLMDVEEKKSAPMTDLSKSARNPIYINPNAHFREGMSFWGSSSNSQELFPGDYIRTEVYFPTNLVDEYSDNFRVMVDFKIRSNQSVMIRCVVYFYDENLNLLPNPYEELLNIPDSVGVFYDTKRFEFEYGPGTKPKYFRVAVENASDPVDPSIEVLLFGIYYFIEAHNTQYLGGLHASAYSLVGHVHSGFSPLPPRPPGIDSHVVPYALAGASVGTLAVTARKLYAIPIVIWKKLFVDAIAINVTVAATGASHTCYVGIYNSDAGGKPTSLIRDYVTFDVGTTGVKESNFGISLDIGVYWVAIVFLDSCTVRAITPSGLQILGLPGLGTTITTGFYVNNYSSLPATAPSSGWYELSGYVPAVGFKYRF